MTTPLIEAIARKQCEQHIREVRRWDTDPAKLEAMLPGAVDVNWQDHVALAEAALTAITEAGYEICPKGTMAALDTSRVAIDDWLNTYAHDMCDEKRVKEARDRIYENGGTLAYIARIQEHNRSISAAQGDG